MDATDEPAYRRRFRAPGDAVTVREDIEGEDGVFEIRMPIASTGQVRNEGDDPLTREELDGMATQLAQRQIGVFPAHGQDTKIAAARYSPFERLGDWREGEVETRQLRQDGDETDVLMATARMPDPETLPAATGEFREGLAILKEQATRGIGQDASIGWRDDGAFPGGVDLMEASIVGIGADWRTNTGDEAAEVVARAAVAAGADPDTLVAEVRSAIDTPAHARPFEGEHSCRLQDPDEFDEFRRENEWDEDEGRRIDAIFGVDGDDAELQALRYPVEDWDEDDARDHCDSQEAILFEPAAGSEQSLPASVIRALSDQQADMALTLLDAYIDRQGAGDVGNFEQWLWSVAGHEFDEDQFHAGMTALESFFRDQTPLDEPVTEGLRPFLTDRAAGDTTTNDMTDTTDPDGGTDTDDAQDTDDDTLSAEEFRAEMLDLQRQQMDVLTTLADDTDDDDEDEDDNATDEDEEDDEDDDQAADADATDGDTDDGADGADADTQALADQLDTLEADLDDFRESLRDGDVDFDRPYPEDADVDPDDEQAATDGETTDDSDTDASDHWRETLPE